MSGYRWRDPARRTAPGKSPLSDGELDATLSAANDELLAYIHANRAHCVYCGHTGPLKKHGSDRVCVDDAACLARGWTGK